MNVQINDVTGLYTAIDVVGPSSRYLMKDITGRNMGLSEFPSFSCRVKSLKRLLFI
jgi:glycine cleavage system aminomethyltransferase T